MAVLDTVPLERITVEARRVDFGQTLLTLIAGVFFLLGWVAAKTLGGLWLGACFCGTAVKIGWVEGRNRRPSA